MILECHIRGDPQPSVQWFRRDLLLVQNDRYRMKQNSEGWYQLIIFKPQKYGDSGRYICKAKNSAGEAESVHFVRFQGKEEEEITVDEMRKTQKMYQSRHIKHKDEDDWETELYHSKRLEAKKEYNRKYKLSWISKLTDQMIPLGSTLKFSAMVDGKFPHFDWYHEDVPLVHGRKFRFAVMNDGKATLTIANAQSEDAGKYRLVAKNYANSIECAAKVTFYEAPLYKFEPPLFINNLIGKIWTNFSVNMKFRRSTNSIREIFLFVLLCSVLLVVQFSFYLIEEIFLSLQSNFLLV